jgi:helicase
MVRIEDIGHLPDYIIDIYKKNGVVELFPPQKEAVEKGIFKDDNFVVAVPTASGKTLIAEFAMLSELLKGGKCLYVVPLRALASEKYEAFKKFSDIGIKVGLTTGDYESTDEWLGNFDIIVTTAEKADSLIRNGAGWIKKISCLVVDEIHLLDSPDRGPTLEMVITRFRDINPEIRIIALSATIPNEDEIADWLNAKILTSEWRPVPLHEGVFLNNRIVFVNGEETIVKRLKRAGGRIENLVMDAIEEGGQALVFDSTRKRAESTAVKLSHLFEVIPDLIEISETLNEISGTETSAKLAECVRKGVAFHHAGLIHEQRSIIEKTFREGQLKVIVSTPTLAAGVNLPARRVIIKSYKRYSGNEGSIPIPCLEYKQMAGRAGRPNLDPYGEAVLIANRKDEMDTLIDRYILGTPERIFSKLGVEKNLRAHVLALVSDKPSRLEELENFFSQTFFFYQNKSTPAVIGKVVKDLTAWEMIEGRDILFSTPLGSLVSKLYIDPLSGNIFHTALEEKKEIEEIGILHLICRTPDMIKLYLGRDDYWVDEILRGVNGLTVHPSPFSHEYEWFLSEFKTALCLYDWINEEDEDMICAKYSIGPGDLRRISETAEWLANALYRIAEQMDHPVARDVKDLVTRIKHGIRVELLELTELKGIGRVRARKLFNRGIYTRKDLIMRKEELPSILGKKIAEKVLEQIEVNDV